MVSGSSGSLTPTRDLGHAEWLSGTPIAWPQVRMNVEVVPWKMH
jgi:hypothetical protein